MTLKFYPKNHSYRLDGRPIPGVTSLIGKGLPKPALTYWSARTVAEFVADNPEQIEQLRTMGRGPMVAALKNTPWQKRDEAAVRGTDVHALAEELVHGHEVDVPEHLIEYVEGYVSWLDRFNVEADMTERSCASRKWNYAGRFDFRGTIHGRHCCADWKTSKGVYGSNALQLAAYDNADFCVTDDDPDTELPLEPSGSLAIVHIMPGHTEHRWVTDPAAAYKDFLHVAYVGKAADRIENYLGPAVDAEEEQTA